MKRFAAVTVWDEARIVAVPSCDACPFRERKQYSGSFWAKCHWRSGRGRRILGGIPAGGFPGSCPLPVKAAVKEGVL